jgi:ribosome-interacting GTPase 1
MLVVDLQANPIEQLEDTIAILRENQIVPRRRKNHDVAPPHTAHLPSLVAVNKNDDKNLDEDYQVFCELFEAEWAVVAVSAQTRRNFERLKQIIFENLDIMRVYAKPPGKEPDMRTPFVLKQGGTVAEFALKVHKDFVEKLKTARVWGSGVYEGQMVSRDHVLQDGDVVELHI